MSDEINQPQNESISQDSNETSLDQVSQPTTEYSDIEKQAMEMGWDPNHQGKTYIPAQEFVNRAPLFRKIDEQKSQILELKDLVRQTATHLSTMRQDAYAQAIRDLESKRITAVKEGNEAEFNSIEAQSNALRVRMQSDPVINQPPATRVDPDVLNFAERNKSWYQPGNTATSIENKNMTALADAVDAFLTQQANNEGRQINPREHLKAIEQEVQQRFAHRFDNPKRNAPPVVGKSTESNSKSGLTGLASRLTPAQVELGKKFHATNPEYTLDHYAKDLDAMGILQK